MSTGKLLAGTGVRKITPAPGCPLAGFDAREGASTGVHDDLFARALALSDGRTTVVYAGLDLIGIPRKFTEAVRDAAHQATGIPASNITLAATHTHCGPVVITHFNEQNTDAEYLARIQKLTVEAIQEAFESRKPARVKTGLVPVSGVAVNRRTESGKPIDEYAGVIMAEDLSGKPRTILVNYACHPTVLGPNTLEITRDFPNYFVERLNEEYGADVVPIYVNGAEGDVSMGHNSYLSAVGVIDPARTFAKAKELGNRLAQCVIDSIDTLTLEKPVLSVEHAVIPLPLKSYGSREEMTRRREAALADLNSIDTRTSEAEQIAIRTEALNARLEDYNSSLYEKTRTDPFQPAEVTVTRIGDTGIVSLPGENFVEIGLGIRQASPFARTLVIGLANDYIGYIPTIEQARLSGYEVISSRVKPEASLLLRDSAVDLLGKAHAAAGSSFQTA